MKGAPKFRCDGRQEKVSSLGEGARLATKVAKDLGEEGKKGARARPKEGTNTFSRLGNEGRGGTRERREKKRDHLQPPGAIREEQESTCSRGEKTGVTKKIPFGERKEKIEMVIGGGEKENTKKAPSSLAVLKKRGAGRGPLLRARKKGRGIQD